MKNNKTRILVVDDHSGVRKGIKRLLTSADDLEVVAEAADGKEAVQKAHTFTPDMILMDVELPDMRGDEVTRRIRAEQRDVKVLAVSTYNDRLYIRAMLESGAVGYITKDEAPELLLFAIRSVLKEEIPWISPRASRHADKRRIESQTLTFREQKILVGIKNGFSVKKIAGNLAMDETRVNRYLHFLMNKFNVDSVGELKEIASELHL